MSLNHDGAKPKNVSRAAAGRLSASLIGQAESSGNDAPASFRADDRDLDVELGTGHVRRGDHAGRQPIRGDAGPSAAARLPDDQLARARVGEHRIGLLRDPSVLVDPGVFEILVGQVVGETLERARSAQRLHLAGGTSEMSLTWDVKRRRSSGTDHPQSPTNPGLTTVGGRPSTPMSIKTYGRPSIVCGCSGARRRRAQSPSRRGEAASARRQRRTPAGSGSTRPGASSPSGRSPDGRSLWVHQPNKT